MARGYREDEVLQRMIELLTGSESGMSGSQVVRSMGMSRITATKYLASFAERGIIRRRAVGNVTVWNVDADIASYSFPRDYFVVVPKYAELAAAADDAGTCRLVRNCLRAGARPSRLILEAALPAITSAERMHADGKMSGMELGLVQNVVCRSFHVMGDRPGGPVPTKNCTVFALGPGDVVAAEAASTALRSEGWRVSHVGDPAGSVGVFFDLDLQKLLNRVWLREPGVMVVAAFGNGLDALKFLAESVDMVRKRSPGAYGWRSAARPTARRWAPTSRVAEFGRHAAVVRDSPPRRVGGVVMGSVRLPNKPHTTRFHNPATQGRCQVCGASERAGSE